MRYLILTFALSFFSGLQAKPCKNKNFKKLIYQKNSKKGIYDSLDWQLLGLTEKKQPICALLLQPKRPPSKEIETVYLLGGVHGEEIATPKVTAALGLEIAKVYAEQHKSHRIIIVPAFNVDGLLKNRRRNAKGIDLNRDFPTKNVRKKKTHSGPRPYAVETRQLLSWFKKYKPSRIISIHQPYHTVGYDGPAKKLAIKMGRLSRYKVTHSWHYATPGSLGTWAGVERKIPTITLELPRGMHYDKFTRQVKKAVLFAVFNLTED